MSTITFSCPECGDVLRAPLDDGAQSPRCEQCQVDRPLQEVELRDGRLQRCVACPSTELFVRKDFPQRLGVTIVVVGFITSSVFWYYHNVVMTFAVLFLTALVDVVLYLTMGNLLECYRCHAQYRGLPEIDGYEHFDLEAFERHRQQAIRLREAQQAANAPDPSS